eukprot:Nk52_evm22s218 gene=Nk52_evmTU22s218
MFARTLNEFVNYNNLPEDNLKPDVEMLNNRVTEMRNVVRDALKQKIDETLNKRARYYSNGRLIKNDDLLPGSAVLLYDKEASSKLDPKYFGPFSIIRKNRGGAYVLKDLYSNVLERNIPRSMIKPINSGLLRTLERKEIEAVLNVKKNSSGQTEYLVKFKYLGPKNNAWIPDKAISNRKLIAEYWARLQQKKVSEIGSGK